MFKHTLKVAALIGAGSIVMTGCGGPQTPPATSLTEAAPTPAESTRAAVLDAKEQELAQREAALKLKEQEEDLARREAEFTAKQQPTLPLKKPAPIHSAAAPTSSSSYKPQPRPAPEPARPTFTHVTVPAGTQLTVVLSSDLTSKTAHSGDTFDARLFSDLAVDGRVAVPAGARVTGTITDVISGSNKIGGIPTLGLRFDELELPDGQKVPINGELMEQGKSDTGRDTAKILGGAAAGAVLGHQVRKDNRGKVIGGILGGAIGAVAAQKTGTEVLLPADSNLTISLGTPIEVNVRN